MIALSFLLCAQLAQAQSDGSEISRSRGRSEGAVVLWPRIIPETDDPSVRDVARTLQSQLVNLTVGPVDERRIEVRPEPERACSRRGCRATSVGMVLGHAGGGCAAVVTLTPPGQSPTRLVPWGGGVRLDAPEVPFRSPPETVIQITELVPCRDVLKSVRNAEVQRALEEVLDAQAALE